MRNSQVTVRHRWFLGHSYIPYIDENQLLQENWIFLVWLSHKRDSLWRVLHAFDISTHSWKIIEKIVTINKEIPFYKVNLVRGVPIDERWNLRYPDHQEKENWFKRLSEEISLLKPQIIYLFWKEVSDFVLQKLDTQSIHHNSYQYWPSRLICAEHPSFIYTYKRSSLATYIENIQDTLEHHWKKDEKKSFKIALHSHIS